jgi:hypothetical protein
MEQEREELVKLLNECLDRYGVVETNIYRNFDFIQKFTKILTTDELHYIKSMVYYLLDRVEIPTDILKEMLQPDSDYAKSVKSSKSLKWQ